MPQVYIALGSNLGNRQRYIMLALEELKGVCDHLKVSSIIETDYVGTGDRQDSYLNAVAMGQTTILPQVLLEKLLTIEANMGRVRSAWCTPREIDLDLIAYDNLELNEPHLQVPHPRMHLREFVLAPLVELHPEWHHPKLKKTAAELLADLRMSQLVT